MYKYITVINRCTKKSVPFVRLPTGEIMITSTDPSNDEDSCDVILGNLFYEFSLDYGVMYKRI